MATRKQAREAIIQILYAKELGNDQAIMQANNFLYEHKIRNKQQEFALNLIHGVCEQEEYISQIMNVFLKTWDIDRLGVIEKNIIKLGIYELLQTNTQQAIVINEAIELTKSFNVQDAFALVNGILDSVAKTDSNKLTELIQTYKQTQKDKAKSIDIMQPIEETSYKYIKNNSIKKEKKTHKLKQVLMESIQNTQPTKTNQAYIKSVKVVAKHAIEQDKSTTQQDKIDKIDSKNTTKNQKSNNKHANAKAKSMKSSYFTKKSKKDMKPKYKISTKKQTRANGNAK